MYSLNWHRSFDVCKLVDALDARRRGRCECFLSLTLVWLDASTHVDARRRARCERGFRRSAINKVGGTPIATVLSVILFLPCDYLRDRIDSRLKRFSVRIWVFDFVHCSDNAAGNRLHGWLIHNHRWTTAVRASRTRQWRHRRSVNVGDQRGWSCIVAQWLTSELTHNTRVNTPPENVKVKRAYTTYSQ